MVRPLLFVVLLTWASDGWAQANKRLDAPDKTLPPGAVSRLGSLRFLHRHPVTQIAVNPDGTLIACLSLEYRPDRTENRTRVHVWDAVNGRQLATLEKSMGYHGLCFTSDGKLAASCWDGFFHWDATQKDITGWISRHFEGDCIACSPCGREALLLYTADKVARDKKPIVTMHRFDFEAKEEKRPAVRFDRTCTAAAYAPDGKTLALCGDDGTLHLWELDKGHEIKRWEAGGAAARLIFSRDSKKLLAQTYKEATVWELEGRDVKRFPGTAALLTPDGKGLAIVHEQQVCLYDLKSGELLRRMAGVAEPTCLAFLPDGKTLATSGNDGRLRLWNVATGRLLPADGHHQGPLTALAFSPDGLSLASSGNDGTLRIWDVASAKELRRMTAPLNSRLAFSPDGTLLAYGGAAANPDDAAPIVLCDPATGKEVRRLPGHKKRIHCLAFSPSGTWLASGGEDGLILWHVGDGTILRRLPPDGKAIHAVAVAPDGRSLASLDLEGEPLIWETLTGGLRQRVPPPSGPLILRHSSVTFTPRGQLLLGLSEQYFKFNGFGISPNEDHWPTFRIWDPRERRLSAAFGQRPRSEKGKYSYEHEAFAPASAALAPDGSVVAALRSDGLSRLRSIGTSTSSGNEAVFFDVADGTRLGSLSLVYGTEPPKKRGVVGAMPRVVLGDVEQPTWGHFKAAARLAFAPNGRLLASASDDGTILLWDVEAIFKRNFAPPPALIVEVLLEKHWEQLGDEDPNRADQAMSELAALHADAVSFLKSRLQPVEAAPAEHIARWIADLGDERFETRDKAMKKLAACDQALPALRHALKGKHSLEMSRRLQVALGKLLISPPPEFLRHCRGVEVLGRIGGPQARLLLEELSRGAPTARLTQAASEVLESLR